LRWNPQRHLDGVRGRDDSLRSLVAAKADWISRPTTSRAERRARFEQLRVLTAALAGPLAPRAAGLAEEVEDLDRRRAGAAILERRDYAFCLYPAAALRPVVTRFLAAD
jgi:hypothetical protein